MQLRYDVAHEARILVAITFHFRPDGLQYLFQVVKALSGFPVGALDIVIVTNTVAADEIRAIRRLCDPLIAFDAESSTSMKSLAVQSFPDLPDPRYLTWSHKEIISRKFVGRPDDYTHFIYVEDDIEFSFANFCYFLRYRAPLRRVGLIPSFLRVEYNHTLHELYCTDQWKLTKTENREKLSLDGMWFMNMENPYIGMFVLDQELADEYASSRSFHIEMSKEVHTWEVTERAAMGLCFETPPTGFYVRYVVPVDPSKLTVPGCALIYHVSNKYANMPEHPHGKMRIDHLFAYGR